LTVTIALAFVTIGKEGNNIMKIVKGVRAVALSVMFSLGWIAPQAFAQSLPCIPGLTCPSPDTTPPTVSITSPTSGATVSGTITVRATASDNRGVAGVQFRVDGADGGAEDTTAPYSISWDTTTVSNGSHPITAVARDAAGNRSTSAPVTVTVSNVPPPAAAVKRYEDTDASVAYSAGWDQDASWRWSGGTIAYSPTPGAQATFTFTGTSVTWIGYFSGNGSVARVSVDGVFVSNVDLISRSSELRVPVFTATGLSNSSHTLTIEVTGLKNENWLAFSSVGTVDAVDGAIVVDAFDVPSATISRLQETDPAITYTGGWAQEGSRAWSARTAAYSGTAGAQATFTFTGTSISWLGARGPQTGIARVFLDGAFLAEVDTYAPAEQIQAAIFTSPPLTDASHTLMIEVTGRKNTASTDLWILVDAFDVTSSGTRFQNTDPSVTYSTGWEPGNRAKAWSEGSAAESATPGAQASFTFTGTSISWIGARGPQTGIARVLLDGVFVDEVDTYSPTEAPQKTVFTATDLASGSHTLTIEVTGRKNAASTDFVILVDAFDVRP
jgi:hypothetical protein